MTVFFADGTNSVVYNVSVDVDYTATVAGPWSNVVAVSTSVSAGTGGLSGGGGTVRIYETRINAAGLPRVPACQ